MVHATLVNSKEGGALQVHTTPPTKFGITLYYAKLNSLPIFLAIWYLTCWEATCAVAGRLFSLRSISLSVSLNSPKSSRWSPLVSICSNNLRKWREERRMCVCVWGGGEVASSYRIAGEAVNQIALQDCAVVNVYQALAAITLATTFFFTLLSLLESPYTDRSSVG